MIIQKFLILHIILDFKEMVMKKILIAITLCVGFSHLNAGECKDLMAKYNVPDPSTKTMKQLKRWVKRKVKDENKAKIEKCLIDRAADNPNRSNVAGS